MLQENIEGEPSKILINQVQPTEKDLVDLFDELSAHAWELEGRKPSESFNNIENCHHIRSYYHRKVMKYTVLH